MDVDTPVHTNTHNVGINIPVKTMWMSTQTHNGVDTSVDSDSYEQHVQGGFRSVSAHLLTQTPGRLLTQTPGCLLTETPGRLLTQTPGHRW